MLESIFFKPGSIVWLQLDWPHYCIHVDSLFTSKQQLPITVAVKHLPVIPPIRLLIGPVDRWLAENDFKWRFLKCIWENLQSELVWMTLQWLIMKDWRITGSTFSHFPSHSWLQQVFILIIQRLSHLIYFSFMKLRLKANIWIRKHQRDPL